MASTQNTPRVICITQYTFIVLLLVTLFGCIPVVCENDATDVPGTGVHVKETTLSVMHNNGSLRNSTFGPADLVHDHTTMVDDHDNYQTTRAHNEVTTIHGEMEEAIMTSHHVMGTPEMTTSHGGDHGSPDDANVTANQSQEGSAPQVAFCFQCDGFDCDTEKGDMDKLCSSSSGKCWMSWNITSAMATRGCYPRLSEMSTCTQAESGVLKNNICMSCCMGSKCNAHALTESRCVGSHSVSMLPFTSLVWIATSCVFWFLLH